MIGALRLRMFAGPNGSGKTTVKNGLRRPPEWFGAYFNPDLLEEEIRRRGSLSLESFGLQITASEIRSYFASSSFLRNHDMHSAGEAIEVQKNSIDFAGLEFNSYHASVLADFLRRKALAAHKSFSFETVMSAPDKVELLREARSRGFRVYLYYVATDDPAINIERVKSRVAAGGHDVPVEKIVERYHRSLRQLPEAIRHSDRAFFFDTSEDSTKYFATVTGGTALELMEKNLPNWFRPVWEQL